MQKKEKKTELTFYCSACTGAIDERQVILVSEEETRTVLHATCKKCQTGTMFFISRIEKGLATVGMTTDLSRSEVQELFSQKAISADDVIEVYRLIHEAKTEK